MFLPGHTIDLPLPKVGDQLSLKNFHRDCATVADLLNEPNGSGNLFTGLITSDLPKTRLIDGEPKDIRPRIDFLDLQLPAILTSALMPTLPVNLRPLPEALERVQKIITATGALNALIVSGADCRRAEQNPSSIDLAKAIASHELNKPELKLWGAFNYQSAKEEGLKHLKAKVAAGFSNFISQPPFLRRIFEKQLASFYQQELHLSANIVIGVPYVQNSASLKHWFQLLGVDLTKESEAIDLLDLWKKAESAPGLQSFRVNWNRSHIEWCKSLAFGSGLHFMPIQISDEAIQTFREAVSTVSSPASEDYLMDHRFLLADFLNKMGHLPSPLRITVDPIIFSQHRLPGGVTYAEQCTKLLPGILDALEVKQREHPTHPYWNKLRIAVERPVIVNIARGGVSIRGMYENQESYLQQKEPENGHFLVINLRPSARSGASEFARSLEGKFSSFLSGDRSPDSRVEIKSSQPNRVNQETDSALHQLGMQGYRILRDASELGELITKVGDSPITSSVGLFNSALNPEIIKLCADQITRALLSTDIENPVILEPGSYQANGVPELYAELNRRAQSNSELRWVLQRTTAVFSDFDEIALRTSEEVLGKTHPTTGIINQFLQLDSTENPLQTYLQQGLGAKIVAGRAINLLDAVGSNYIAMIDGKFYQVAAKTQLNMRVVASILNTTWQDHHVKHTGQFSFQDHGITADKLAHLLTGQGCPDIDTIMSELQKTYQMPLHRALFFWKKIYESLEQDHDYIRTGIDDYQWVKDQSGKPLNHLLERVLRSYPGNHLIPDSARALQVLQGILPIMNSGAEFTSVQLTTSVKDMRATFHGWRSYGVTFAMPIVYDLVKAFADHLGVKCQRITGDKFAMSSSNSAITFRT